MAQKPYSYELCPQLADDQSALVLRMDALKDGQVKFSYIAKVNYSKMPHGLPNILATL